MSSKYLEKAEQLLRKGKLEGALEQYLLAWKEEPANDSIVQTVADLYQTLNRPKESRDCYGFLFDKHVEKRDGPKASEALRKMQRMAPVEPSRFVVCAELLEAHKPDQAAEFYRHAMESAGAQDAVLALRSLQGLARMNPSSLELQQRLAVTASRLGQATVAATAYQQSGELLAQEEKWTEAAEALESSYHLSGKRSPVRLALARASLKAGRPARVVELLETEAEAPEEPEALGLLAEAYLAERKLERAHALYWKLLRVSPQAADPLFEIAEQYIAQGAVPQALEVLQSLEQHFSGPRSHKELIAFAEKLGRLKLSRIPLLEYATRLFDRLHLDSPLGEVLQTLFDLHFAAGQFGKAAETLERLIDVDPYAPQCSTLLRRLEGKAEPRMWKELTARLGKTANTVEMIPDSAAETVPEEEVVQTESDAGAEGGNTLQDLMLQAEIFLQYRMDDKARERLRRIAKLFPGEEEKNEELKSLFEKAKLKVAGAVGRAAVSGSGALDVRADLSRISEITRNLFRQGTVKGVLSAAVNDIGRLWQVSRCVAGLVSPNRPPSMALEYISQGVPPSESPLLGKLVMGLQQILVTQGNPLVVESRSEAPQLASLQGTLNPLQVESLVALPLREGEQHIGILVLEQCSVRRSWKRNDVAGLEALAEQVVLAVSNVRLRNLMKTLAVTDERSGLLHRDSYLTCLLSETERIRSQKSPLTVTLLRFLPPPLHPSDHWKEALEKVEKEFLATLVSHLRQNDFAVRYDSDSLALILPGTAGKDAVVVVDKLRKLALSGAGAPFSSEEAPGVAAGISEALREGTMESADIVTELINRVEEALESAQQAGGNVTKLVGPPILRR